MRRLVAITACALLASGAQAEERERTDAPPLEPSKIILVVDSTMALHSGWGGTFCAHHVTSSVACLNVGRRGRAIVTQRPDGRRGTSHPHVDVATVKGAGR